MPASLVDYNADPTGKAIYITEYTQKYRTLEIWESGRIIYKTTLAPNGQTVVYLGLSNLLPSLTNKKQYSVGVAIYIRDGGSLANPLMVETVTFDIPENAATIPSVSISQFEKSDLKLDCLIAKQSKIQVTVSGIMPKYGASISSVKLYVGSRNYYIQNNVPVEILAEEGLKQEVYVEVTDSRGIKAKATAGVIDVYSYDTPKIVPTEENKADGVIVSRAILDEDGNIILGESYEYLYICGNIVFSALGGKNKCKLEYKKKRGLKGEWEETRILLNDVASNATYDSIVPDERIAKEYIYYIELSLVDTLGAKTTMTFAVPSEKAYMERSGARNSIAFGGHVTENNACEIYQTAYFRGGIYIDDLENNKRYKIIIDENGNLKAQELRTTFNLRRR